MADQMMYGFEHNMLSAGDALVLYSSQYNLQKGILEVGQLIQRRPVAYANGPMLAALVAKLYKGESLNDYERKELDNLLPRIEAETRSPLERLKYES